MASNDFLSTIKNHESLHQGRFAILKSKVHWQVSNLVDMAAVVSWPKSAQDVQLFGGPNLPWPLSVKALHDSELTGGAYLLFYRQIVVGYCQLKPVLHGGVRLCRVIINPQYRRCGYGRQLIAYALLTARHQWRAPRVELGVYRHNVQAMARYQYFGFKIVNYRAVPNSEGGLWTIVEMEKHLSFAG